MTLNIAKQNTKIALYLQAAWCVILLCIAASWFYQDFRTAASALLFSAVTYLALAAAHQKHKKLIWPCLIPPFGSIIFTTPLLADLWYYLYKSTIGEPATAKLIGAIGMMALNSTIGIILPLSICLALLNARKMSRSMQCSFVAPAPKHYYSTPG